MHDPAVIAQPCAEWPAVAIRAGSTAATQSAWHRRARPTCPRSTAVACVRCIVQRLLSLVLFAHVIAPAPPAQARRDAVVADAHALDVAPAAPRIVAAPATPRIDAAPSRTAASTPRSAGIHYAQAGLPQGGPRGALALALVRARSALRLPVRHPGLRHVASACAQCVLVIAVGAVHVALFTVRRALGERLALLGQLLDLGDLRVVDEELAAPCPGAASR